MHLGKPASETRARNLGEASSAHGRLVGSTPPAISRRRYAPERQPARPGPQRMIPLESALPCAYDGSSMTAQPAGEAASGRDALGFGFFWSRAHQTAEASCSQASGREHSRRSRPRKGQIPKGGRHAQITSFSVGITNPNCPESKSACVILQHTNPTRQQGHSIAASPSLARRVGMLPISARSFRTA